MARGTDHSIHELSAPTTTEPGSTSEESTSSDGTTTASDQPVCGDDIAEGAEECDFGKANADDVGCTIECKLATCGDGLVWKAVEQCDMGARTARPRTRTPPGSDTPDHARPP